MCHLSVFGTYAFIDTCMTKLQNNNKTIGTRQIGEVERHNEQNIDEEKKTKMAASSTLFAILPISIV